MKSGPAVDTKQQVILSILCCPTCRGAISLEDECCVSCGASFSKKGNTFYFTKVWEDERPAERDSFNRLKEFGKQRFSKFYPLIVDLVSPVYSNVSPKTWLRGFDEGAVVANLGAGTTRLKEEIINVDLANYEGIDLVADLSCLPFKDEALDGFVNIAVLEHVPDPEAVVKEMRRVLKPGGKALVFVPFIQGFHASPFDFQRFTQEGMKVLFKEFKILWLSPIGPTSAFVWIFQEWLAMILSLGSMRLYQLIFPMTLVLSPLKYLDLLLAKHPAATQIATGHFIEILKD